MKKPIRFSKNQQADYELGEIIKDCLAGEEGARAATEVCARLKAAVAKYEAYAFDHDDLIDGLFKVQPIGALSGLCGGDEKELRRGIGILRDLHRKYPLGYLQDDDLIAWFNEQPQMRYLAIAHIIKFAEASANGSPQWTRTARRLLAGAADPAAVLRAFVANFDTSDGTGSPTGIVEANAAAGSTRGFSRTGCRHQRRKRTLTEMACGRTPTRKACGSLARRTL